MNYQNAKAFLFAMLAGLAAPAYAADEPVACPDGLICASDPAAIVAALQESGYRAKLDKTEKGEPIIESAAAGYNYTIYLMGCKEKKACSWLSFQSSFDNDDGNNSLEWTNEWNSDHYFSTMSLTKTKTLVVAYDVTMVGGLNKTNFSDVVVTWSDVLGEVRTFFNTHTVKKK